MLLCRLSYRAAAHENGLDAQDVRQYHFTTLRRAATRIADFVCSLQSRHLKEFWLSFTGHLIVSAATILLRCAIDTADAAVAEECKESLKSLRSRLHRAKNQDQWDLADMFLKRCDEPISRITSDSQMRNQESNAAQPPAVQAAEESQRLDAQQEPPDFGLSSFSELNIPIGPLDYPWESLWDMFEGPQ
ncbi:hypothetical protein DBV05_g2117 [Lasiodiplodia theobromae]|uniref:Uncharacterized protein n=1 Tax=Lasiodiplodia theobromae TaxID=45133 RepID=A0A5N5DMS1_9PEZI|nr:hypothetical protein DBV05_g2117 [Lasiodiplodia theobromae]